MAKVELEITDQMREDQIVTALEGGVNYWAFIPEETETKVQKYMAESENIFAIAFWKALKAGETLAINDAEDEEDELGTISMASIELGEQKMAQQHKEHFMNMYLEQGDAETADVWFQLAVMGSLTFS